MINMLTQQIGTMFNPLIQNTNWNYELLGNQMGRITNFFDSSQAYTWPTPQTSNVKPVETADNGATPITQGKP